MFIQDFNKVFIERERESAIYIDSCLIVDFLKY